MSVYKNERVGHFKCSVDSMLCQTVLPEQFVIVKDGPLYPELDEAIDQYVDKFPNLFTILVLENNVGLGAALDEGLKICRNELVARMDSDDISFPDRCEKQLACFTQSPSLDIVGTYIVEFKDSPTDSRLVRKVPVEHSEIVKFAQRRSPFNHPTVMYKKSAVLRCGGYGKSTRKEDLQLFPAMVNRGFTAKNIPEVLLYYRAGTDNLLRRKSWSNCRESIEVIYKNYRKGYSKLSDLIIVAIVQFCFFLMPISIAKFFSNKFLRSTGK